MRIGGCEKMRVGVVKDDRGGCEGMRAGNVRGWEEGIGMQEVVV